ncbi:amidase [Kitasatospora sp. NPDC088346]|uniref:amidase n=1 Tax=Kitasatospora sp. NPDC088346 TaxID=3364073 RepID=UPI0037FF5282
MSLPDLTLAQAADAVRARRVSPVELVDAVLERIEQSEPLLNAYATVTAEQARRQAREAEREAAAGQFRGPLHGVPMALKDLIDAAGTPTGAGSRVRAGHRAATDSAVAARLAEAGAILVGKAHTHELAYGLTTPQTRNAWDGGRVAGGSSGGSAVAVAAGSATFALGTDTGGSIRVPAALNGVVGLKPTYDLLPRRGVTSLSWSLDHVGPLTRTTADAALVLRALTPDGSRAPSVHHPRPAGDLTGLRVGVPSNHYFDHVDQDVETAVRAAVARLEALGATLVDVEIPLTRYLRATHWGLMVPEASAYHERALRAAPDLFGADVRVLLEAGALMPALDYLRAQRARTLMREAWAGLFATVDVIAAPTVPTTAARTGQPSVTWPDGTTESVPDAYVRLSAPANITGIPALSLPVGLDRDGLPIGMQLLARPLGEAVLLRTGRAYEQAAPATRLPFAA